MTLSAQVIQISEVISVRCLASVGTARLQ